MVTSFNLDRVNLKTDTNLKIPVEDFDVVKIFPVYKVMEKVVYLEGHVKYPREYELKPGMKLRDLIPYYDDLLPEPHRAQAEIVRLVPPDQHPEIIEFNLGALIITALALVAVGRARHELVSPRAVTETSFRPLVVYGGLIALGIALFASPFASQWPDGLDRTAESQGFAEKATAPLVAAPAPDYAMPGIHGSTLATSIAGAAGTVVVFGLAWVLARVLGPRRKPQ